MTTQHRYQSLDSLRGVAAILVVLYHVGWNNHLYGLHAVRQAFLFVDLFFILSGFVIATVYGRRIQTSADAGKFMVRRFFRLYPLHVATLLFLVVLESLKYWAASRGLATASDVFAFERTVPAIFVNLAFLHGVGVLGSLSWNTPSWSISCEMVAYGAFALLAVAGFVRHRLFWLMIIPIILGYAFLIVNRGTLNLTYDVGVIRCLCGFFLGALIVRMPPAAFPDVLAAVSISAAALITGRLIGPSEILVVPVFAVLIYALRNDDGSIAKLLLTKPMAFLGKISFSIYLVHDLVISVISTIVKVALHPQTIIIEVWDSPMLDISPFVGDVLVAAMLLCTVLVARLTYKHIEVPGQNLGRLLLDRMGARRGRAGDAARQVRLPTPPITCAVMVQLVDEADIDERRS